VNLEKPDDINQLMRFVSQEEIPQKNMKVPSVLVPAKPKPAKQE
jgi:hypothetical protein